MNEKYRQGEHLLRESFLLKFQILKLLIRLFHFARQLLKHHP